MTGLAALGERRSALALLAVCLCLQLLFESRGGTPLRTLVFDGYQRVMPRHVERYPVRVVDVDEASLRAYGQWPWPRHRIARLVEETARLGALAVGVDVILSEPGRFSPGEVALDNPALDADLRARLARIPSNDELLGLSLSQVPSVVARVGRPSGEGVSPGRPARYAPVVTQGGDPLEHLVAFQGVTLNVPPIEAGASGHGLVNSLLGVDGVVRRVPVVAAVAEQIAPSLALELLRVATGTPLIKVHTSSAGIEGVTLGDAFLPLDPDGAITLHFAPSHPARRLSAVRVLSGELPPGFLDGQVAIIGVTALGTTDAPPTPISGKMDGVEIQAQVLESLISGERLLRPAFAPALEVAALLLAGLVLIAWLPRLGPRRGSPLTLALLVLLGGGAWAAFALRHWLLDPAMPMLSTVAVFAVLLSSLLALEKRRARELGQELARQRTAAARLSGELDAARKIQMGILPDPAHVPGLPDAVQVAARLEPARTVGGDLYDLFMVDAQHLFFAVGDVSGKGIPASLFMALSKTLCKSIMMRAAGTVAERLSVANAEIARENPEMLFVTVVAGVLNTATGDLDLCIAGHDAPWLLRPGEAPRELEGVGGPPLCVLDDFDYPTERFRLQAGDVLLLTTDGVTEAMNPDGELYGRAGLLRLAASLAPGVGAQAVVDALTEDVVRFAAGAEPADDVTVLVLEFRGPPAPVAAAAEE